MINFKHYNPVQNIDVKNTKNPGAKNQFSTDNHLKLKEAIEDLNKRGGQLLVDAWYFIENKETYELLNGADIICRNGGFVTDYDGTFLRIKDQYNGNSNINLYYKLYDHENRYWWIQKGDKEPRNKQSIGIEYMNCRKNEVSGLLYGFTKGLHVMGDANGTVENNFNFHIRNCRYGIYNKSTNSGWGNQNTFKGSIRGDGFVNRRKGERTESAMIWNQGNGQAFLYMNLENGISNYQYTIYDTAHHNDYVSCRFEYSTGAGMIKFTNSYGSPNISGGYGYAPNMISRLGVFYDEEGQVDKKGFVHRQGTSATYNGNGSMFLGGEQAAQNYKDFPTLTISNQHHRYNSLLIGENQRHKKKFIIYADGEAVFHQGNNNFIDLAEYHKRLNIYNLVEYKKGDWYQWGDWFDDTHFAEDLFQADEWEADEKKIGTKPNSQNPIIFKDGYIYCKGIKELNEL